MSVQRLSSLIQADPPAPLSADLASRAAAVAAVLRQDPQGALWLLFIRRAEAEGDPWSGHMAFPGGRRATMDVDLQATAERETLEELSLDLAARGSLLGVLSPARTLPIGRGPLMVQPYVYRLWEGPAPTLEPNREVASAHWIPLAWLASGAGRSSMRWQYQGTELELPCIYWGQQCIWGLTLRLLEDLLSRLAQDRGSS